MAKTELTKELEYNLFFQLKPHMGVYGFHEVTIQDGYNWKRIDFVTIDRKGLIRCYEIKTSYSDFNSKNGHNFYGHYNYYVVPRELVDKIKDLIPNHVGIVVNGTSVIKNPKKQIVDDKIKNNLILGMLCSGDREIRKSLCSENVEHLKRLESELLKARNKWNEYYDKHEEKSNELSKIKYRNRKIKKKYYKLNKNYKEKHSRVVKHEE